MKKNILGALFFACVISLDGQYALDTYYANGDLIFEDHVYQAGIKTVKLHPFANDQEMPIIELNSGSQLVLQFDDLFEDFADYSYTIYHCNENWTRSTLMTSEYMGNFVNDYIRDFEYSLNALIPYTHYQVAFPNENVKLNKSGNYLLVVYRDDNEKSLVISKRFLVYESLVNVSAEIKRASPVEKFQTHQEIDFSILHGEYNIQNPFQDLKVHVMQNFRYDNAITDLKPRFLQNGKLDYLYDDENTFEGLNEFRFFDFKNLQTLSMNVRRIERDDFFTVYLKQDVERSISRYSFWEDLNGKFTIRRLDATDYETEADYALVDFMLMYPRPVETGDVYIFGQLTDWKLRPEFKMQYDYDRQAYRAQVYLKQGYYNFTYATSNSNMQGLVDIASIEGSHWETENDYHVLVYNRELGSRYDRLIGYGVFSSDDLY